MGYARDVRGLAGLWQRVQEEGVDGFMNHGDVVQIFSTFVALKM